MAEKRIKRKLVWEEAGVSEIIGTILMLSITVVLFSSIITFVGRMPAPQESFNVEVDCYLVPVNPANWSEGVNFIMVHQGGKVLDPMWINIFITVDQSVLTKDLNDGLQDDNGDGDMGVGESWIYEITQWDAITLSSNSTFSITIIHQEKNLLIWQETLGEGYNVYRPIIIDMWIDSDLGTLKVNDPGPVNYVGFFKVYAEIKDPEGFDAEQGLDVNNIWVNLGPIYDSMDTLVQLKDEIDPAEWPQYAGEDALGDDIYVAICSAPNRNYAPIGYHFFHFNATDNAGLYDMESKLFPVGMIVGNNPQIVVRGDNPQTGRYEYITFSDPEPINGNMITISATIKNQGGGGANINVTFFDGIEDPAYKIGQVNTSLSPQSEREASLNWEASPGGNHTIIVVAELDGTPGANIEGIFDPVPEDNRNYTNLSVMPKILLVDDDGHLNNMDDGDTVSFMRASLEAADFDYDFVAVGSGDGPGYDYGDYPLEDYDLVIWMSGYDDVDVLTNGAGPISLRTDDLANLQKFLDGDSTGGNGGSLWFITEGFWNEANGDAGLTTFAEDYLHIPSLPTATTGLPAELYGRSTHNITDYYATNPVNTVSRISGTGDVYYWDNSAIPDNTMIALNNSANTTVFGLTYDSDDNAGDPIVDSRIFVQTWDFSRIKDTATQAQYTYKAIMWLGNITMKYTQDVAISEQTIEPKTVFFKQDVTINFVVRNNGFEDYDYRDGDELWYLLTITDVAGNDIVTPHLERIDFLGSGVNNTLTISYPWTPEHIGYHRVAIKLDPYNYIKESNELNNEISSFLASGELFVQYRILVVDDDGSLNNNGPNTNETREITNSLDYLNSTGTYSYETYIVNQTDDGPAFDSGMNGASLSEYNAILWVGGEVLNPLTTLDMTNLTKYMDMGGNLWFIGNGLWTAADESLVPFEQDYLKVGNVDGDRDMSSTLWGVEDDYVSHGMEYASSGDPNADIIVPVVGGIGFTCQDNAMSNNNSVRYHGSSPAIPTIQYRAVTTPWLLSALDSNDSKAEFTFMILRWFDKPESRIETRITNMDISLSDEHPQLGSGYVIQATVHNTGGSLGNVLVRFVDGTTQIGSDSISVSAGETTTAEIIWVPLFAGQRNISVLVDPIAEVDEIFDWSNSNASWLNNNTEWSNNNATKSVYVYFFWDDMENGDAKWAHSSTVLLINGEEPLEYFYDTVLDTNIVTNWDDTMSENLNAINDFGFYHTLNTAFWLQEPAGGQVAASRIPVDVVFALDTSGSMTNDDIQNMRNATKNFISQLTDTDRAAIYTFDGGGWEVAQPMLVEAYQYMTAANKNAFNITIDQPGFDTGGYTCFYDTLGSAITYSQANLQSGRLEFVVGMTDGVSNSDDTYTPNANWADIVAGDTAYSQAAPDPTQGILNPPCMVYTIGLGIIHDPLYPTAPDWSRTSPRDGVGYGIEYDVWNCADSSPIPLHDAGGKYGENETTHVDNNGHYFYTTDSAQLPGIFQLIFSSISQSQLEGENQTRSVGPLPRTMATASYTYSGVTQATNDHYAWFLEVDSASDWQFKNPNNQPEFTNTRYTQVVSSDNSRAVSLDPGRNDETFTRSRFTIAEVPASITQIDMTIEIQGNAATNFNIWTYNVATDTWAQLGANQWADADADVTITRSILANCHEYISGTGQFTWGCYQTDSSDLVRVDYMEVDITYTSNVAPYIVSTVPSDGAFDIPTNDDVVITFSEPINPTTFAWSIGPVDPSPGSWTEVWSSNNTIITLSHPVAYTQSTAYTMTVTAANDMDGNPLTTGGAATIDFSDFESGWNGWASGGVQNEWELGNPTDMGITPYSGSSCVELDLSADYNNNANNYLYKAIDLTGAANAQMTFWHYLEFENNYDGGCVMVSNNGGTSWNLAPPNLPSSGWDTNIDGNTDYFNKLAHLNGWTGDGPMGLNTWEQVTVDLSAYDGQSIIIRFWMTSDFSTLDDGWAIDDIRITKAVPNPWTFTTAGPPVIITTAPFDTDSNVLSNQDVVITFSRPMNTGSLIYTCVPDPGGWTVAWSGSDTIATLSHNTFVPITGYTFTVTQAMDTSANNLVAGVVPNPWTFTTLVDDPPEIVATVPANGVTGVAVGQNITITFSEAMNTGTVTYSLNPNSLSLVNSWSGGDTILTISHSDFAQGTQYTMEVLAGQDLTGNSIIIGAVPNPWSFLSFDNTPPEIILTTPSDGSTGVGLGQPISIRFNEAMNKATAEAAFTCNPDPGGWTFEWNALGTEMTAMHYDFNQITAYTCTISNAAEDLSGNSLVAGAIANPLSFTTGISGGGGGNYGISPDGPNSNKTAVTETLNLENLASAKLSFWHKYNMMPGANGGFLEIGYYDGTSWQWKYVIPANAYTGNLRASTVVNDSFGTRIFWCWNGISSQGTFDWEFVTVNLLNYVPTAYRDEVKVKFNYTQYGGGTGYGWYIDDVRVTVCRSDLVMPTINTQDIWNLTTSQAHSGTHSWSNIDPNDPTQLKAGIDNYLMTTPIDLTNAKSSYLSAYLKFNINEDSGAPPDGFRVEISKDNGVTWISINLGVRTGGGVSGTGKDADDGNPLDDKTYTGLTDSYNRNNSDAVNLAAAQADGYWVGMGTLSRVNIDLSSFSGNAIHIRFRTVTCSHTAYEHNNNHNQVDPGFGGFYVDDVIIYGETILT